jgi:hypothetical protein
METEESDPAGSAAKRSRVPLVRLTLASCVLLGLDASNWLNNETGLYSMQGEENPMRRQQTILFEVL